MKFKIFAEVVIRDKNGKVVRCEPKRELNSYVMNMIVLLRSNMNGTGDSLTDIGNTSRTIVFASNGGFYVGASAGLDTMGIVVGTGTTAVEITDKWLGSKISHGTSSGQLSYGACSIGTVSTVGSSEQFTIARTFTNNSGADINIKEVGLYARITTSSYYACIERSLLNTIIGNGQSGTVTYTISASV